MASQIKVNEIIKQSGSSISIGESGDTIDLTGNVGIGTSSPDYKFEIETSDNAIANFKSTDANSNIRFTDSDSTANGYAGIGAVGDALTLIAGNENRLRVSSSGRVTIGGTSTSGDTLFNLYSVSHLQNAMAHVNSSDTGTIHNLRCINASGTLVGGITNDGSNTTFATSSDYRLKANVDYTWNATTRLKQLKPARFNWIADDTNTLIDGFIAHEVSSIVPEAVRGAKDATRTEIDENGDEQTFIEPQGIDQGKLVPLLTKALQEAITKIETLEAKVAALESK